MVFIRYVSLVERLPTTASIEEKGIFMIKDIFKERIKEHRQFELDEAEKARKKAEELAAVLKKAEEDISELLKKAPISAFKIPSGFHSAIVIALSDDESKGDFTKYYSIYTGYADILNNFKVVECIGTITLAFSSIRNSVDFSKLFENEARMEEISLDNHDFLFFVFYDSEAD